MQFTIDGQTVEAQSGETILAACRRTGYYIPHLCFHGDLPAQGNCRLCLVESKGRLVPACLTKVTDGMAVASETERLNHLRLRLTQMLFVEGNHICPSCEASGNCMLQAMGYRLGLLDNHYPQFFPRRPLDASHPQMTLDFNRCIQCQLCVRASDQLDHKHALAVAGRGGGAHIIASSPRGLLGDTPFEATDHAAHICPVGVFLAKGVGYVTPIGERRYDRADIAQAGDRNA